jgi:protein O-GlcNAc transferase
MTYPKYSNQNKNLISSSNRISFKINVNQPNLNTILSPATTEAYFQHAQQAFNAGQWSEACRIAQTCISVAQNDNKYLILGKNLYATALLKLDQKEQALALWLELSQLLPNNSGMLANVGMVLIKLQRESEAIPYYQRSVQIAPLYSSYINLGFCCHKSGEITLAKESYLQALVCDPTSIQVRINLAEVFREVALFDEAQELIEQAYDIDPQNILVLDGMICLQHFRYPLNIKEQMIYLRRYEQRFEQRYVNDQMLTHNHHTTICHSPLRVGFISSGLSNCPEGFFLESTIEQIKADPQLCSQLVLIAYNNSNKVDTCTQRLHQHFNSWYQVAEYIDDRLIEQIRQDRIDILIDLSGHTTGNRLPVFARKVVPIQVSWLGYFGSTGLSSIDYVLADPICVPVSEESGFVEKIWRLPHLRYCFSIPEDAPEVSEPPCLYQKQIVLGCYQMLPKINDRVLQCWSRILEASPQARLRIQFKELKSEAKTLLIARLVEVGIDIQRVDLVGAMIRKDYLASYSEVDFLLDTFPYTGGTTTVEALWMGVPTLTLSLPSMLGRQGEAILVNAGLTDWVTHSEDEYVQKAMIMANANFGQRQDLAILRSKMRDQVRQSHVFNAKQFAHDFVGALSAMWNKKCAE